MGVNKLSFLCCSSLGFDCFSSSIQGVVFVGFVTCFLVWKKVYFVWLEVLGLG